MFLRNKDTCLFCVFFCLGSQHFTFLSLSIHIGLKEYQIRALSIPFNTCAYIATEEDLTVKIQVLIFKELFISSLPIFFNKFNTYKAISWVMKVTHISTQMPLHSLSIPERKPICSISCYPRKTLKKTNGSTVTKVHL